VFLGVLLVASVVRAETVVTKDGKRFTGDVKVDAHTVRIVMPEARRTLALTLIKGIELDGPERLEFEKRRRALPPLHAKAHYDLGQWLKSKYQHPAAREFFQKAITIDADMEAARRELGHERKGGEWDYSPALHHSMWVNWVGVESRDFHWKLAGLLHEAKATVQEERALRRVLQADSRHRAAIRMIRPLIADYVSKNRFRLPFDGRWHAVAGPLGYNHSGYSYMMNAWDLVKVDERGRSFSGDPRKLESYYTYEASVFACADGEVYEVRDEFDDHRIGGIGRLKEGNRVLIRHAHGERSVIGHLKKGTITVKAGDKVKQGQLIGRIGNNGHSVRPHIHFAVYDADGISLPVTFHNFQVIDKGALKPVEKGRLTLGKVYLNTFGDGDG